MVQGVHIPSYILGISATVVAEGKSIRSSVVDLVVTNHETSVSSCKSWGCFLLRRAVVKVSEEVRVDPQFTQESFWSYQCSQQRLPTAWAHTTCLPRYPSPGPAMHAVSLGAPVTYAGKVFCSTSLRPRGRDSILAGKSHSQL